MTLTSPMQSSPNETKSVFKNPLLYSSVVLAVVALVVGWILFSRWSENKRIDSQSSERKKQTQQESDRTTLEQMGGKELDIQAFYASPGAVHRGEA